MFSCKMDWSDSSTVETSAKIALMPGSGYHLAADSLIFGPRIKVIYDIKLDQYDFGLARTDLGWFWWCVY